MIVKLLTSKSVSFRPRVLLSLDPAFLLLFISVGFWTFQCNLSFQGRSFNKEIYHQPFYKCYIRVSLPFTLMMHSAYEYL
jgi:hypothetical protein